jgi:hypothetical protein
MALFDALEPVLDMPIHARAHLLRNHREHGVYNGTEITRRDQMDDLLHGCGIIEVGFRAGVVEIDTPEFAARLLTVLQDPAVRDYSENHYPLRLPRHLRSRLERRSVGDDLPPQTAWFARLLSLDRSFQDSQLDRFLRLIDWFNYSGLNFHNLRETARERAALLDAVATPRDDRTATQEALAGLERFLFFCRDLHHLMDAAATPDLAQSAFDLYRYWFDTRRDELQEVVDNALTALAVDDEAVLEDLPERRRLDALFQRAAET